MNAANSNPLTWTMLMTTTDSLTILHKAVRKRLCFMAMCFQQPMFHGNVCLLKTNYVII